MTFLSGIDRNDGAADVTFCKNFSISIDLSSIVFTLNLQRQHPLKRLFKFQSRSNLSQINLPQKLQRNGRFNGLGFSTLELRF